LLEQHFKTTCLARPQFFFPKQTWNIHTKPPQTQPMMKWWFGSLSLDSQRKGLSDDYLIITIWSIQDSKSPVASRASQLQIPGRYPNVRRAAAAQYRVVRKGSLSSQMVAS
jgi:hypothetical protein